MDLSNFIVRRHNSSKEYDNLVDATNDALVRDVFGAVGFVQANFDGGMGCAVGMVPWEGGEIALAVDMGDGFGQLFMKPLLKFMAKVYPEMLLEALKSNPDMVDPVTGLLRLK